MNIEDRPNPEELLKAIEREDTGNHKGRLKIFLGMAAGVGKTFSMLMEARQLHKEGVDVVIGIVDTHGRKDTESLLTNLKTIPLKTIEYKGIQIQEMDLQEIIRLHPKVVLVDELAHSNLPGSRHLKRWQDVIELLDNGIDVYTTLNVQHIESLKDIIEEIAEIPIKETVPDLVIDRATYIQIVDITTDELLQRLKEGKVYFAGQSEVAATHFFQKDRLTALREIVLRYAAEKVDHDLHGMVSMVGRGAGWKPRDKLLVAISHEPQAQRLIRVARRLAFNLDAPWIVMYVNDGRILSEKENATLMKNLALSRDLGAEVILTESPDIAEAIQRVSRQKGVTQVVIGRSKRRSIFGLSRRHTLLDRLARDCGDLDVHAIKYEKTARSIAPNFKSLFSLTSTYAYFLVMLLVGLFTGVEALTMPYLGYQLTAFIFFLGLLSLSLFFRKGPLVFAVIVSGMIWEYSFMPENAAAIDHILLVLYLLTAIVIGVLADRMRTRKRMSEKRENRIHALYDIVKQIATAPSMQKIIETVTDKLGTLLNGSFEILIKSLDNGLDFENSSLLVSDEKEKAMAIWVFEKGQEAGWSTHTLPSSLNLYIPLKSYSEMVGVLIYRPKMDSPLNTEEVQFLYTVSQQFANYLARTLAEERVRQEELHEQIEKIYQTVLKSITIEMQSPLNTIQEAVQALKAEQEFIEQSETYHVMNKIENSSEDLSHLFESVSLMAKLSRGIMPLHKEMSNIQRIIDYCHESIKGDLRGQTINIMVQDGIREIFCDAALIEVLIHNLLLNAVAYSPDNSTIEIEVHENKHSLHISIADEGTGIPEDMIEAVFEKFFRLPGTKSPGIGLGLSLAKKIAELHNGVLKVANRPVKGAIFTLILPFES